MSKMMKAAVFIQPGRIELVDKPIPDVGPNDALVRITTTTLCGTDVHILKGEYPVAPGLTVGHEPVGIIEKLGSAVVGYREGQRVIAGAICPNFNSYAAQDGVPSQDGSYLVESGRCACHGYKATAGWRFGNLIDGTQAEYVLVPDAQANLAPIPDGLSDEQVLMCPDIMSTGFKGAENANIRIGDSVAIFAQGPIGLCATAGARLLGASTIIAIDGNAHRLDIDEQSGTYDTFKELVLASHGKSLASDARRFESNDRLAAAVSADPHAIGFVGIASVGRARALAIADGESLPMAPQESLIATEDYPLSRRLFLYLKPGEKNPWAQALVRFAQGPRGQAIVTRSGFVAQKIQAVQIAPRPQMPAEYRKLAEQARRLTVNFRFQEGSALLDNKALLDVQRLLDYLRQNRKLQERTVLVGFGDPKSDAERSVLLSRLRAMAVRRELARGGVSFREIAGFGDELPVASNDQELGRQKNRRVEVWVY